MPRIIQTHPRRIRLNLNGAWDFLALDAPTPRPPAQRRYRETLSVPGVWESSLRHSQHRGFGWYHRAFVVFGDAPVALRLVFEAVSHTAQVWLDDRCLGGHYGAHTEFEFIARGVAPGAHRLSVLVDNTFGPHNPLFYPEQDLYLYGGLARDVYAEILPPNALTHPSAIPRLTRRGWVVDVREVPRTAAVTLDGRLIGHGPGAHPAGRVAPWTPDRPRLYTVAVETGSDIWQERIGFRTIATRGRTLLLNGKSIILRGVNRHEFHPDFGSAVPATVHQRDIEILKRLGANFVRGSHYPNDPLFLDLCDANGILVWEELSHWQPRAADWKSPDFRQRSLEQIDEMVARDKHHPSVILWGMLNEGATDLPEARPVVRALARRFRAQDDTRLITFASNRLEKDRCFDFVDVLAINIYPGWYWSDLATAGAVTRDSIRKTIRRGGRKPLILSEFGAAGMAGVRGFESRRWTENYQADLLREIITTAQKSRDVCGVAIWQYCDVRTSPALWWNRVREYNNKGLLSEHREPKQAFDVVRELFAAWGAR